MVISIGSPEPGRLLEHRFDGLDHVCSGRQAKRMQTFAILAQTRCQRPAGTFLRKRCKVPLFASIDVFSAGIHR